MKTHSGGQPLSDPLFLKEAKELNHYLRTLSAKSICQSMKISGELARKVMNDINAWQDIGSGSAALTFRGDIYSGLQADTWNEADQIFAQGSLRILSGLYGILKPLDAVKPYRLEMGYRLPDEPFRNLYKFWNGKIAESLPKTGPIINLAAAEYSKTVTDFLPSERFVSPQFYTISPKTGKPAFVVVHTKIARGAFASWLIKNRIEDLKDLEGFSELNYQYAPELSSPESPAFVCETFGGIGLSVRLA